METKAGVGYNKIKQKRTPPKQKAEGDAEIQTPSVVGKELDPDGKDWRTRAALAARGRQINGTLTPQDVIL